MKKKFDKSKLPKKINTCLLQRELDRDYPGGKVKYSPEIRWTKKPARLSRNDGRYDGSDFIQDESLEIEGLDSEVSDLEIEAWVKTKEASETDSEERVRKESEGFDARVEASLRRLGQWKG